MKSLFEKLTDKEKIMMSVIARNNFSIKDTDKTIGELIKDEKNGFLQALAEFEGKKEISIAEAQDILGNLANMKLVGVEILIMEKVMGSMLSF